jgi:1,4-dihydroxy-6-naphthoate synthase
MKLTLGFSPCPNDTFLFDALVNRKIDTEGIEFEAELQDVQTLNEWAMQGRLDITKLSFPALYDTSDRYDILNAGAALGKGVGPLLIARKMVNLPDVAHCTVAIPGINTTANFLLSFAFPSITNKVPMLFSEIESAVLDGRIDMGVIIHENRFTYKEKGLIKIVDLGEVWEERMKAPIPLGCIAIKKEHDAGLKEKVDRLIHKSLQYANTRYPELSPYVKEHAQEMNETVMRQHIQLYVNDHTLDLGKEGKRAVDEFFRAYKQQKENMANPSLT